jgi:hypothetical protein
MHAIIAENENLIVFTDNSGKVADCFEYQRLSFTGSLTTLFEKEKKDDDLRFAEKISGQG